MRHVFVSAPAFAVVTLRGDGSPAQLAVTSQAQASEFAGPEMDVLLIPGVEGRLTEAHLATEVAYGRAGVGLANRTDALFL